MFSIGTGYLLKKASITAITKKKKEDGASSMNLLL
jgi:hypothetical protein